MKPFRALTARAVPLNLPNIDTDQIIPARYIPLPQEQQVDGMFHDLRFGSDGQPYANFPLNLPAYSKAQIIVAGRNFACGSSRENAVTVLMANGFRAFVAPSFGEIFHNNCLQLGALPITLPEDAVAVILGLVKEKPEVEITIDLESQTVALPGLAPKSFNIDAFRKECLLEGVDDIDLTRRHLNTIERFEANHFQDGIAKMTC